MGRREGTRGGMDGGREGGGRQGGREGARGWWGREESRAGGRVEGEREGGEGAMILGRQRASMEEGMVGGGRVDEGNERRKDGTRHGRREGGSERRRDCARKGGSKGAREVNFKLQGMYPEEGTGQCTVYSQTISQRGPCH